MIRLIVLLIVVFCVPAYALNVVPSSRHFIYTPAPNWQFWKHNQSTFKIRVHVFNSNLEPTEISAECKEVALSESGKVTPTGKKFAVRPQKADVGPKELYEFEIVFPIPQNNKSYIFAFICTPEPENKGGNIELVVSEGWVGCISFVVTGKYHADPKLIREGDYLKITNPGEFCIEGSVDWGNHDKKHYFINAGKHRLFKIPDNVDHAVNDCPLLDKRQGIRFTE